MARALDRTEEETGWTAPNKAAEAAVGASRAFERSLECSQEGGRRQLQAFDSDSLEPQPVVYKQISHLFNLFISSSTLQHFLHPHQASFA